MYFTSYRVSPPRYKVYLLRTAPAIDGGKFITRALEGLHCNVYIFLFWELRGLSPNFHIHVSVSDLYIPRIGPHISSSRKGRPFVGIYNSLTDT
jgi:hypothetical protein